MSEVGEVRQTEKAQMDNAFRLPDLGEGVHEGQIIRLFVNDGDRIEEDQPLMEVETDKAAVEIPSPVSGIVQHVHVKEEQVVYVGDVMVTFGTAHESAAQTSGATAAPANVQSMDAADSARVVVDVEAQVNVKPAAPVSATRRIAASPAVRKLARRLGLELSTVSGSGPGGRITRADVEQAAAAPVHDTTPEPSVPHDIVASSNASAEVAASNLASKVEATPPPSTPVAPLAAHGPMNLPGTPSSDAWGQTSRLPITRPRRVIAQTMMQSWTTIPHVTDCDDADVTKLNELRREFNESNKGVGKISLLPFVIRAIALALRRYPIFNASFDTDREEIVYHDYINIAIGVQTERGLIAPVIRNTDHYGVVQLHSLINAMTEKVRTASFEVNDLRGGTFTVSNAGAMGGSRYATPIINPQQVAVLAIGRSKKMPWVVDDAIVPRLIMPLSLSFDHRIIDGAEEIAFQQTIVRSLENPVHFM